LPAYSCLICKKRLNEEWLLAWNVLLTLIAGYLLIAHFSGKKSHSESGSTVTSDTSSTTNAQFRIAYFEMDSVEANYSMVKDIKVELSKREDDINNELERLRKDFEQKYNYYQSQAQEGKMTQPQSEAASQELKVMDDKIKTGRWNWTRITVTCSHAGKKMSKAISKNSSKNIIAIRNTPLLPPMTRDFFITGLRF